MLNVSSICKFYRSKQGCRFKENCRYRHSDSSESHSATNFQPTNPISSSELSETGTLDIAQGQVIFEGNNEAVKGTPEETEVVQRGTESEVINSTELFTQNLEENQLRDIQNDLDKVQIKSESVKQDGEQKIKPNRKICSFFSRKGWCQYGRRCRFEHLRGERRVLNEAVALPQCKVEKEKAGNVAKSVVVSEGGKRKEETGFQSDARNDDVIHVNVNRGSDNIPGGTIPGDINSTKTSIPHPSSVEPVKNDEVTNSINSKASGHDDSTKLINKPKDLQTSTPPTPENTDQKSNVSVQKKRICWYFRHGYCQFGRHCKFSHDRPTKKKVQAVTVNRGGCRNGTVAVGDSGVVGVEPVDSCESSDGKVAKGVDDADAVRAADKVVPCDVDGGENEIEVVDGSVVTVGLEENEHHDVATRDGNASVSEAASATDGHAPTSRCDFTEEMLQGLRETESTQLKRRLHTHNLDITSETPQANVYTFVFSPTDPDWMFCVEITEDRWVPDVVRRYIETSIADWLVAKGKQLEDEDRVELVFRPFLRWLDRNLEDIVTDGLREFKRELEAKAAGFEFIPAKAPTTDRALNVYDDRRGEHSTESDDNSTEESGDDNDNPSNENQTNEQKSSEKFSDVLTDRRGTEIMFRNLQLLEGVSTVLVTKVSVIVQCERCKNDTDIVTPSERLNEVNCSKCNTTQRILYRPSLCHQFSSVAGYLDVENCAAFDVVLQDCEARLGCEGCSQDMGAQSLSNGQIKETWCRSCHAKMRVAVESVRLTKLAPSTLTDKHTIHKIIVAKTKRVLKDPAIQEGRPLPDNGTCKHYKKSFRWFRFPCCGKCYPCDVCHEETESGDHEMKLANRIICGHCAKEQPFSNDRPCIGCDSSMTKSRSAFWEGGRGCRDKVAMSRNDVHKFKNSNKTVSSKAKAKNTPKKTTK